MGCDPDEFCNRLYHRRPDWADGMISLLDSRYLFSRTLEAAPQRALEFGTASGVSTAFLCEALRFASQADLVGADFEVVTYDITRAFYADESKAVGDAAREMLSSDALDRVTFRNPATVLDARTEYPADGIDFLFIDAEHRHPWPALDLIAALDLLSPGAEVILHDINLPVKYPDFPHSGVKRLFDGLEVEKHANPREELPNIGSLIIPGDKAQLRDQLVEMVSAYDWEVEVDQGLVDRVMNE